MNKMNTYKFKAHSLYDIHNLLNNLGYSNVKIDYLTIIKIRNMQEYECKFDIDVSLAFIQTVMELVPNNEMMLSTIGVVKDND